MSAYQPKTGTHTLGPWIVDPNPDLPLGVIMDTEDGLGICELEGNDDESRANAHLIAAAPAMYEAIRDGLVLLEASYHDMVDKHGHDSLHAQTVMEQIERTRDVLAQAEGRHAT